MNIEKRDFDKEAAAWDEKPVRIKLVKDVASAISEQIVLTSDMKALDFGCGTGLLTTRIEPMVGSITGMDSSQGMLDVFNKKVEMLNLTNVRSELVDIDKGEPLSGSYDLIVSSMTLHHIMDTKALLDQFYRILLPGGYLAVADLDLEEGKFHSDNTGVFHFGFDRAEVCKLFKEAGFDNVGDVTAAEVVKPTITGEMGKFSLFLMVGQKS